MNQQDALRRVYKIDDKTCALCGDTNVDILYQSLGGWWCKQHSDIPQMEHLKAQEPLLQGIKHFINYHT